VSSKICPQCGTRYPGDSRFCTLDGASLTPENPADTLAGRVIADRYLVREKLGEGGMGEVYLAEHVRMKRKVAVKVMRKWLTSDAASIGRFHREAENASQITHPNVAAVYDFGETSDGLVYLAMEYVPGEPLTNILEREGTVNHIRAADLVSQVADALGAAHALGILHRDLKPDNVMIATTRSGTNLVKLLDFGIARVMGRETQHFTSTGLIVGTPDWMSPEQISGDQLDARSDIYALGLIAFRMLTGVGAFGGGTSQETLLAKMTKPARRLAEVRPEIAWPQGLQAAFDRVLAAEAGSRYADALAFASDFYYGASQLPMTPDAEQYLAKLAQRGVTPARGFGVIDSTPTRGVHTVETPVPGRSGITAIHLAARSSRPPKTGEVVTEAAPTPADRDVVAESEAETVEIPPVEDAETGVASPVPDTSSGSAVEAPVRSGRRLRLVPVLGVVAAVITAAVLLKNGEGTPATAGAMAADSADSARLALGAAGDTSTREGQADTATAAGMPGGGPVLDSVARASHGSVFGVVGAAGRKGAGFLADSSGIVLTASSLVGRDTTVRVYLDPGRWVYGRVVRRDAAAELAAVLVPLQHCAVACTPLAVAPDTVMPTGDSVAAVIAPSLVDSRRDARGGLTRSGQRLRASIRLLGRGTGAPLLRADGRVVGVVRSANASRAEVAPAAAVQGLLAAAKSEIARREIRAIEKLPPSWPARAVSRSALDAARGRSAADVAVFRVGTEGFDVFVMTPQVMAWRKALTDSLRRTASPFNSATSCFGRGVCDPLQEWTSWDDYLVERRAVVIVQISPDVTPAPRIGETQLVDFRRGNFASLALTNDSGYVEPIEAARIHPVPNAADYSRQQKPLFYAGVYVFRPADFVAPTGAPRRQINLTIADASRGNRTVNVTLPRALLEAVARDVGAFARE
jgi:serine/threonine-protein kinase